MVGSRCPTRHLHPSREQAFVAGAPSTTNTTRSTSLGWPFSLPKALYSRGFLRKAADFESQPATLSYPGFLSDSAIPLCFREGEHEAKSGSPRHTVPGDTGAWTRAPMRPQASLRSRERFWDIRVPKIDSIFDNSLVPRPSWSPGVPPQHRKLVAATHRSPI